MKDGIYTLDHFYDVLRDEMGEDYCELLQELVERKIAEEIEPLQNNIDILSKGFDEYQRETNALEDLKNLKMSITTKLNNKIYEKMFKPNYSAEVGE